VAAVLVDPGLVDPVLVDLGALPVGQPVALVLAQNREVPPGKGDEFGKASPVGLVVVILLFLATILLVRSMNKHLRKVPASFDKRAVTPDSEAPDADPGSGEVAPKAAAAGSADDPARD
jgi:hypothetical protein